MQVGKKNTNPWAKAVKSNTKINMCLILLIFFMAKPWYSNKGLLKSKWMSNNGNTSTFNWKWFQLALVITDKDTGCQDKIHNIPIFNTYILSSTVQANLSLWHVKTWYGNCRDAWLKGQSQRCLTNFLSLVTKKKKKNTKTTKNRQDPQEAVSTKHAMFISPPFPEFLAPLPEHSLVCFDGGPKGSAPSGNALSN